jgi:hypothetical protein
MLVFSARKLPIKNVSLAMTDHCITRRRNSRPLAPPAIPITEERFVWPLPVMLLALNATQI